jgi:hypothetical protein
MVNKSTYEVIRIYSAGERKKRAGGGVSAAEERRFAA